MKKTARTIISSIKSQILRRIIYYLWPNEKIKENLKNRRGKCLGCGKCCQVVLKCPMLYKVGNKFLCKIHQHKFYECSLYPINQKDIFKHLKHVCGYWFIENQNEED